ncbi:MAG: hypothetical protein Q8J97_08200 [Flavobacteriaceae bacterium]|nr:hypothetical protein [Flavobacteriaceae bacterium]
MLKNLVNFLKNGNIYNAVEVVTSSEGKDVFYFIKLKRKKNELTVLESAKIENLEDIPTHIKPTEPVFLVVNTNKVLSKIIERTKNDVKNIVNRTFPNIRLDDFYYDIKWTETFGIVSVCRKELPENIIKNFSDFKINFSGFTIGLTEICTILPLLKNDTIEMASATLYLNTNPPRFSADDTGRKIVYEIDGIKLNGEYLLSFSGLISGIAKEDFSESNLKQRNQGLKKDFYYKVFYEKFLRFGIVSLFALLFVNFLIFNSYFQKTNLLEQEVESNRSGIQLLKAKNDIVTEKEKKLSDLLYAATSKSSLYLDQLSATALDSIQFSEVDYQPYEKKVTAGEEVSVKDGFIRISGFSLADKVFSEWLVRLQKLKWIKNISISDFVKNKNNSFYNFEILIETSKDGL